MSEVRRDSQPNAWDIWSGTNALTQAFAADGWATALLSDVDLDAAFNILDPLFMAIAVGIISEGRVLVPKVFARG